MLCEKVEWCMCSATGKQSPAAAIRINSSLLKEKDPFFEVIVSLENCKGRGYPSNRIWVVKRDVNSHFRSLTTVILQKIFSKKNSPIHYIFSFKNEKYLKSTLNRYISNKAIRDSILVKSLQYVKLSEYELSCIRTTNASTAAVEEGRPLVPFPVQWSLLADYLEPFVDIIEYLRHSAERLIRNRELPSKNPYTFLHF